MTNVSDELTVKLLKTIARPYAVHLLMADDPYYRPYDVVDDAATDRSEHFSPDTPMARPVIDFEDHITRTVHTLVAGVLQQPREKISTVCHKLRTADIADDYKITQRQLTVFVQQCHSHVPLDTKPGIL